MTGRCPERVSLIPLAVPWKVEYGTPNIRASVTDAPSVRLEMIAFFGSHVSAPHYRWVSVDFPCAAAFRMSPAFSDVLPLDPDLFAVRRELMDSEGDPSEFGSVWAESGLCPDPRIYRASDSRASWVDTGGGESMCHFVVVGELAYFEVLSRDVAISVGAPVVWDVVRDGRGKARELSIDDDDW